MRTLAVRRRVLGSGMVLAAVCWGAAGAMAQDPNQKPNYGAVALQAGFEPDPFVKPLVAGGPIATRLGGVQAFVARVPDFQLVYTAGKYVLTIHVESAADTTLLIHLPDGSWVANDDGPNTRRNPLLKFTKPPSGRYDIWVGTYGKAPAPATLKITEKAVAADLSQPLERAYGDGPLREATQAYEQAVRRKDDLEIARTAHQLAYEHWSMGQYREAEPLDRRGLEIREARLGRQHPLVAESCNNLATVCRALGQYTQAEALYQRCLAIREAAFGKNDPRVALVAGNLGNLYADMKQFERALELQQRSLAIYEARLGKYHLDVALRLRNVANTYAELQQFTRAEGLWLRSLRISEARLGKDHPEVATTLRHLAAMYVDIGRFDEAERRHQRCLEIREAALGKNHPDVVQSLGDLAYLLSCRGQYAQAEAYYRRCLQIHQATLGPDHPSVASDLDYLGYHFARQKKWPSAVEYLQAGRQAAANHLAQVLPSLSEPEQLKLLHTTLRLDLGSALSIGWTARQDVGAASAEWLLNGKAAAFQGLAEQYLLARDTRDPRARQLVEDLQRTRAQLAALVNRQPAPGQEARYQQELQKTKTAEQALAQKLARGVGRPHRDKTWVTLAELRAGLSPKAVFVDIARFEFFDFAVSKRQAARYTAWVTSKTGDVQLIDLGLAAPIDQLVAQARKSLITSAASVAKVGDIEASEALQPALKELSTKVLQPLLPALEKFEEWIVCPDGALWLAPWSALLLPDGKFAVERHLIRHVISGRDLVLEWPRQPAEAAYVFADPDYDFLAAGGASVRSDAPTGQRKLPKVPRLPGTAAEAAAVAGPLQQWLGREPQVYLQGQASETRLKAVQRPRVLTLATHGYFLPAQEAALRDTPGAALLDTAGQPLENPLLRCGLLLAGCNRSAEAAPGQDDGILTGLEILGLDLRGCELVVLSACETGLGDVRSGEGVAGLRQAFQLAGAKCVLASLWQVPDRETALLMNAFYSELAQGRRQAEALRNAQLQRIAARREQFGTAHPFFWAAFALTTRGAE